MTKSLWIKASIHHTQVRLFQPVSLLVIILILLAVVLKSGHAAGSFQKQFNKASDPALMLNG